MDSCVVVTTGQPHASATARPGGSEPIRHVQRGEDAERLDRRDEVGATGLEALEGLALKRLVLLVYEHLAPVLDHHVTGGLILIAQERTAEVGPAVPIHLCPVAVR